MTKPLNECIVPMYPTIQALDVDALEAGEHKFWFAVATDAIGHPQTLPVRVFKGAKPGKRIVITAGVHGDEQNGILSAQKIARELEGQDISGCITIVPAVNLSGIARHSRDFHSAAPDSSSANLNRIFPGNPQGDDASRYAHSLWENLLKPNADLAIDLHSQTSGSAYPLYAFADYRIEDAIRMARLINPDVILNDPGDPGILETVYNRAGIPSITIEVGVGRYTDLEMVERATAGVMNVLRDYQLLEGDVIAPEQNCVEGNSITSVRAEQGGFVICHVELMQPVETGQKLATQYNSFGDEIQTYFSPTQGTVISHNVESVRAPGSLVVRLIH
ncbi:putative succinate dehydrogenase subunit Sdh [Vibrio orientalis CIP 102891 = ATCC 33934]|uniref:Predicted deacylase n=1 Tax=Vibrio orientalis CIP 102891 = ATCC 33934 TaxID=675816 RepID=C9QET4_VIBOR|nr:succinylglutamate desuccinylase/aspartoacylase family protein [Vibrio orientalis]EEX94644.1 predicted deacylase [Vibrio orientalis CIP 102891 = ATCC 33934]EGU51341.1 putative succinate dehydrogenase subunit Sdh [Vibrio orientalis CIP 102891 = ATCC 33934]